MIKSLGLVAALLTATACGGGSSKKPDANTPPSEAGTDASNCTSIALGAQDFGGAGSGSIEWVAPVATDLGDGGDEQMTFQFYGGIETLTGSLDLATGMDANYATCAACLVLYTNDASGMPARSFFQSSGSLMLSADPLNTSSLMGSTSGVTLDEVTIDPMSFMSTPVAGGECLTIPDTTLAHNNIPNAYTCAPATYNDGVTCDCNCGSIDPDCFNVMDAPVTGCTGQVCSAGACVAAVANDTCQTAVALTVGTPVSGTTVGATSDYNSGLEGATCTNDTQDGGDVAYKVNLTAGTGYTFTLSNVDPNFDASIALVGPGAATVCDADPIATCVAGADAGFEGDGETFSYTVPTGKTGTYYVIVDSFWPAAAEAGAFTVEVTSP